jgi:hypothetical protein
MQSGTTASPPRTDAGSLRECGIQRTTDDRGVAEVTQGAYGFASCSGGGSLVRNRAMDGAASVAPFLWGAMRADVDGRGAGEAVGLRLIFRRL